MKLEKVKVISGTQFIIEILGSKCRSIPTIVYFASR